MGDVLAILSGTCRDLLSSVVDRQTDPSTAQNNTAPIRTLDMAQIIQEQEQQEGAGIGILGFALGSGS